MTKVQQLIRLSIVNESGASPIRAIVGERVYPAQIATITNPQYPCISFEAVLSPTGSATNIYTGNLRSWCWSRQNVGTINDAEDLHDKLKDYWHLNAFSNTTLARWVRLALAPGVPIRFFDETSRVHAVIGNWTIHAAEI